MKFDQLTVLLPCLSLEDFALSRSSEESEQLLSGWSALWHPALIHATGTVPSWAPAESPPAEPSGHLVIVPDCSGELLPDDWLAQAEEANACVLRGLKTRPEMIAAILERLHGDPDPVEPVRINPEIVADFLALGYCHLMVELLTRQLRYMSNLDEESFKSAVLLAVEQAVADDLDETKTHLQSAFDLLHEAREYFYPVEAHLLDLTLIAETTLGQSLRDEMARPLPTNLLISGEHVREMARREPETLEALLGALERSEVDLLGGDYDERPLPLLPPEAMWHHFHRGANAYQEHLGRRPTVFGRRRFGLTPILPGLLRRLGFTGAMHSTLDDGKFPTGNQSQIQWEGVDATLIETLGRVPSDVGRPETFLTLPERLGDSMDLDHVATIVLAHWPGQSSRWYEDLRRIASFSPVLGTFSTVTNYFEQTGFTGQQTRYKADQYQSPYLRQAVDAGQSDPISRWVRYHGRRTGVDALQAVEMLTACLRPTAISANEDSGGWLGHSEALPQKSTTARQTLVQDIEDAVLAEADSDIDLQQRLLADLDQAVAQFAAALCGDDKSKDSGYLAVNPWSFSRRLHVDVPDLSELPNPSGAIRAVGLSHDEKSAVVDLPAMGFAWIGPGLEPPVEEQTKKKGRLRRRREKGPPPLAEQNVLRNEFCKVTIDPSTGAVRSIADYHSRGARIAQQVALRMPQAGEDDPGADANYSIMAADELAVTSAGPLLGEIVCRGRLVDREARLLAQFTQTTRLRRGSRVVEIDIELDPKEPLSHDPWNSYYAARFAWGDATANMYRSVNLANVPSDCVRIEAPHFVDLRADEVRTTLLTGGLPYHRRFGLRKLDTLLAVHGETARSFRLGIGIDLADPMSAALGFLAPQTVAAGVPMPSSPLGWLFHLDSRHVIATSWHPVVSSQRLTGFRARLLEVNGRSLQLGLRSFRPIRAARKLNPGDEPTDLAVDGDRITIPAGPHEWIAVEAEFEA